MRSSDTEAREGGIEGRDCKEAEEKGRGGIVGAGESTRIERSRMEDESGDNGGRGGSAGEIEGGGGRSFEIEWKIRNSSLSEVGEEGISGSVGTTES